MDHDPWLINEVRRLTSDLLGLQTNLDLVPRKFELGYTDKDSIVVVGSGEWRKLSERVSDAREEIIQKLNDFVENDYQRQLHWSALRMLTAAGVLATELSGFNAKLKFMSERPGERSGDVAQLVDWFDGQVLPVSQRLSSRLLQFISRVLDPESWSVTGPLTGGGPLDLTMNFEPKTEKRSREQREKEKRLARVRLD
ncbi:MAG: hypothetical protein KJO35_06520 [Gammaproteobacteria bacterium]|nr:hypothetical protein [Gammaproteobacteria bacterium]